LGGTKIQAVVIDESDSVAGQARRSTPRDGGPADVADAIAEALEEAAKAAGGTPAALTGIGVGSPGTVNEATGTVANARNLRNWTNPFPLGETLASRFGVPVRVGNDVGTAVEGEAVLGAGRLGPQPDRRRGGRGRWRPRHTPRRDGRRADPGGDASPPLRRRPAAGGPAVRARRSRRRDLGRAAGAGLALAVGSAETRRD